MQPINVDVAEVLTLELEKVQQAFVEEHAKRIRAEVLIDILSKRLQEATAKLEAPQAPLEGSDEQAE